MDETRPSSLDFLTGYCFFFFLFFFSKTNYELEDRICGCDKLAKYANVVILRPGEALHERGSMKTLDFTNALFQHKLMVF